MTLSPNMRVLLVAKPWRGGLPHYVHQALCNLLGRERVTYISTRPQTIADELRYRQHRAGWPQIVMRRIYSSAYDAAIFLSPLEIFAQLTAPHKNICWLVDEAQISAPLAAAMGHIFLSDPGYAEALQAAVPAGHYAGVLPFAMLPSLHRPSIATRSKHDLCFIANAGVKRDSWLTPFLRSGVDCHVYGNYFPWHRLCFRHPSKFHGSVSYESMGAVYARHHLSLNIHTEIVRAYTNMRTFEAAGYGTAQLVEARPGLDALFEPGKELITFSSQEELQANAKRLLADRIGTHAMAERARSRVLAEHTYEQRVQTMLARVS